MANKRIEYSLEVYKPEELQRLPATDECRHYHTDTPFPAIHVGDQLNAWVWKFVNDDIAALKKAMGGREPEPMEPIAVVERVLHDICEGEETIRCRVIVFTKLYKAKS